MLKTLDIPLLESKVEKSLELLRSSYRSANGHAGWYHYLDNQEPGPTASAVGLLMFKISKQPFEHTDEVLAFLKSRQIEAGGAWAISMMPNQPSVEASGWVIKCLGELHPSLSSDCPDILGACNWLEKNINSDGGWGSYYEQPSRTYLTCMAMKAIGAVDPFSKVLLRGRDWLLKNRTKSLPAWGATAASPPTVLHTSFVLLTLAELNLKVERNVSDEVVEWILNNLNPSSAVETVSQVEDYDIPFESNNTKLIYQNSLPHYALPIAVSALLHYERSLDRYECYEGLLTIAKSQLEGGYWENARNPTRISIWAIWPFFQTLVDAINLPVLSSAKTVTKVSDAIIIRTSKAKTPLLLLLLLELIGKIINYIIAYWSLLVLALFLIAASILATKQIIGLRDLFLSLVIPIALIFIQMSLQRRTKDKSE
jgi:hypothetical protein